MTIAKEMAVAKVEWRRAKVSQNRQVTIPRRFFDEIGIKQEVEFGLQNGYLVVRPVQNTSEQDHQFAEFVLRDLVAAGLEGEALVAAFTTRLQSVRPAVESLIEESERAARDYNGEDKTQEIFGDVMED
jgi:bifunctional DNA-binding transcriptional regulator/antitoxin component of YhaV-PrlF toxin-antitoxin module